MTWNFGVGPINDDLRSFGYMACVTFEEVYRRDTGFGLQNKRSEVIDDGKVLTRKIRKAYMQYNKICANSN